MGFVQGGLMKNNCKSVVKFIGACALTAVLFGVAPARAQEGGVQGGGQQGGDVSGQSGEQPRQRSQTLDTAVALVLQKVFELMQAEQFRPALAELDKLIAERGDRMKPFDKATTYELRGSVKASLEDYRGALRDFQTALETGALPPERNNQLRYFIAQLYFQLQDYQSAIRGLQEWIRAATAAGIKVDSNAYYLLAAAYTQLTPPDYRSARGPAEQALAALTEPRKGYYDLLNLIYSELNDSAKRGQLLERMINYWPNERSYWTQLSGLYATTGRDGEAFSVLEVAYRAGLLRSEGELLTLIQYYSFYDNPFRGAKVLERELAAGSIKRTVKNLTLLSQLWSQAREHKRAIPVLQEASGLSDTGELSYRLGQVLVADEQYAAAERALNTALRKGGMTANQTGDANLLLGLAIFSQAGPEDRATRRRAREAFVRATNYPNVSGQARQWVTYIDAINQTEEAQDRLECQQREEARLADIERLKQSAQVCRLQGGGERCDAILQQARGLEAQATDCSKPRGQPEMTPAPAGSGLNDSAAPAAGDAPAEPAAPASPPSPN
jgi:tetratricopeptide (TPR) repeat protein